MSKATRELFETLTSIEQTSELAACAIAGVGSVTLNTHMKLSTEGSEVLFSVAHKRGGDDSVLHTASLYVAVGYYVEECEQLERDRRKAIT